ncbi:hypothetical protein ELI_0236 [Eubacterium callanderi]|uniref:Uncharacterized protein n=1 Tax=Eubacterium callanderi TaxID=53442 RepID=E3GHX1_9FIRM|nr:hypothetical protein ELI_0236 [Eubacterium callanderi]
MKIGQKQGTGRKVFRVPFYFCAKNQDSRGF